MKVLLKSKFDNPVILIYKSNRCYDSQLKVVTQNVLKKEALIFLLMALLIEKRNSPLIKIKKNVPHRV